MDRKKTSIKFSRIYKKWYSLAGVSIILTIVLFFISQTSFMQEIEYKTTDQRFRFEAIPERADSNVVIIAIDDSSLEFFSSNGISWPWPRSYYAYVVDYLTACGARSVLFDMQFYEPDIDREETYAEETDGAFAESIKNNGNVFLGIQLSMDSIGTDIDLDRFSVTIHNKDKNKARAYYGLIAPLEIFLKEVRSVGIINVEPDGDGVIRRIPLLHPLNNYNLPQMAFSGWLNTSELPNEVRYQKSKAYVKNIKIPLDDEGNYLINWYGNKNGKSPFSYYPFKAVVSSASSYMYGGNPLIAPGKFKDKHIIIGATAAGLLDLKTNPYTKILPGMEIWATALSNFLKQDFIQPVPDWINFFTTFVIIFLVFYLITHFNAKIGNLLLFLLLLLIFASDFLLWKYLRAPINFTLNFLGFIISYLLMITVSYLLEGKSKREIRKIFTRYLHPDVIKQLEENPDQVHLGGGEINATVLYTDIYNFTTISETKTPKALVEDLNDYFRKLTGIVLDHSGLLDKYMGDGIMAIFGAPISRKDHALLACEAAFVHKLFREELAKSSNLSAADQLHIKTRTGINSGLLVAGNIGSDKRMDYTAIGDTVNLASRLEGVNKVYQTNIIISENTYKEVKDTFLCRELDFLKVKGKTEPTRIYELINKCENLDKPVWISEYEAALVLYRAGEWEKASEQFKQLGMDPVNDSASKVMLDRCLYLIKNPPDKWDGILTLEVK
ncbi:CHASE2 domain-containing protein [Candidatus Cloacimonadota bacterium]